MTDVFGDLELADVWDADPTIAPEQVTYRLHMLRRAVDQLTGRDPGAWDRLTRREQDLALSIGANVTDWIATHDAEHPVELAESLHNVRVFLAAGQLGDWADLSDDERAIAVDLMALLLAWLRRQGPR